MNDSSRGANAPSLKDELQKQQPIAGSKKEADDLRKQLYKPLAPSPSLTIGGGLEKASHEAYENKKNERIKQIEENLERTNERVQLKSKFNSRSRTRTRR